MLDFDSEWSISQGAWEKCRLVKCGIVRSLDGSRDVWWPDRAEASRASWEWPLQLPAPRGQRMTEWRRCRHRRRWRLTVQRVQTSLSARSARSLRPQGPTLIPAFFIQAFQMRGRCSSKFSSGSLFKYVLSYFENLTFDSLSKTTGAQNKYA